MKCLGWHVYYILIIRDIVQILSIKRYVYGKSWRRRIYFCALTMILIPTPIVCCNLTYLIRFSEPHLLALPAAATESDRCSVGLCSFTTWGWPAELPEYLTPLATSRLGGSRTLGHRHGLLQQHGESCVTWLRIQGKKTACVLNLGDWRWERVMQISSLSFLLKRTALSSYSEQPVWRHPRWLSGYTCWVNSCVPFEAYGKAVASAMTHCSFPTFPVTLLFSLTFAALGLHLSNRAPYSGSVFDGTQAETFLYLARPLRMMVIVAILMAKPRLF